MTRPLWEPSSQEIEESNIKRFIVKANERYSLHIKDYRDLDAWSVEYTEDFWSLVWDFTGVIGERTDAVLVNRDRMPGARWFPDARLNFAENLLRRRDAAPALIFWGENAVKREISHTELYNKVSRLAQALRASGVEPGDCVASFLPNIPEAVVGMLATASIGAIWSSCSPDFGVQGVIDRFGQIKPKVLLAVDGYYFNGKTINCLERLVDIRAKLPTLESIIVVSYISARPDTTALPGAVLFEDYLALYRGGEISFARMSFAHPLYIVFSSGTTGIPKCIVHGAGGTLLQHLKEHMLHVDVHEDDRLFYHTTTGWMMWNWLVSGLACGATILLYDGSPYRNKGTILFEYAESARATVFGTSAIYIETLMKNNIVPRDTYQLKSLRTILSTGSPLSPRGFEYAYAHIKPVRISSISGGTDIISCFLQGNPILPVWSGEMQCRGLGMAVAVYNDTGTSVIGEKGELVCTAPFPAMPIGFLNDSDGEKYRAAYFEKYPGVWRQGDYAEMTSHYGYKIYGRSDSVLKPSGVRIGTAEIYTQVEQIEEVEESLATSQEWHDGERIILFVKLRPGMMLSDELTTTIRKHIFRNTTQHHVPAKIVQVRDIPRTKSGKITELAVREVIAGRPIKNFETLANPEALEQYKNRPELLS